MMAIASCIVGGRPRTGDCSAMTMPSAATAIAVFFGNAIAFYTSMAPDSRSSPENHSMLTPLRWLDVAQRIANRTLHT
ncbi:hypothetical protein WS45_13695 [Burkholderia sp. RF2-non_BP3]|nr:hypothetical protein WS45_13695 [Burkholderia sp. RF2-non_BP3]